MDELFRAHWGLIYRYMARRVETRQTAEDLAGDVFARAVRSFGSWRGEAPAAWLLAIARNVLVDHSRRKKLTQVALDDLHLATEALELGVGLRDQLGRLPERDRRLLELLHVHDFTVDEVAAMSGATNAAVRSAAYRARASARAFLNEDAE